MQLRASFPSVLFLLFYWIGINKGIKVLSPSAEVRVGIGQKADLNCSVPCTHKIFWVVQSQNNIITMDNVMAALNGTVTITELDYCSNDSMRKQVFEVTATSQWHKMSVQCAAEPLIFTPENNSIIYSRFSTVYVDDAEDYPPTSACPPSQDPGSGVPGSIGSQEPTSGMPCTCATSSASESATVSVTDALSITSSAQPIAQITHLLQTVLVLIGCYILL